MSKRTKNSKNANGANRTTIIVASIGAFATIMAAILGALFGNQILTNRLLSTPEATSTPLSSLDQILTADAIDTQRASDKGTIVAQATQTVQAISTRRYKDAYSTAEAEIKLTQIFLTAEQDVATAQAQLAALTAQADVYSQGTATASAIDTIQEKMDNAWSQGTSSSPTFVEGFDNDLNGWTPKTVTSIYAVMMDNSQLNISLENAGLPFFWTCDKCGPYKNFLMQIDITTPNGLKNVYAGILLGSPTPLDRPSYQYTYEVLLDSSGVIYLKRLSPLGEKTISLWDNRTDIISPDGKPRTLQIIGYDKYISIYINGNSVIKAYQLDELTDGYIGVVVSTARNTNIQFDNLKIYSIP